MPDLNANIILAQDNTPPDVMAGMQQYANYNATRESAAGQKLQNEARSMQIEQSKTDAAYKESQKRDLSVLAQSTLGMRGLKYQATPDADGVIPRVIPGTEDYDVKNNWWYGKDGEPVEPLDAPFYKPDGSVNSYSRKFIDGNVEALKAHGASAEFINSYAESAEANSAAQSKAIRETIKAQGEIAAKTAEVQKARGALLSNAAYDIVNATDPEHALQIDLLYNPQHAQMFGIDQKNPPDSQEAVAKVLESLKPIAATSEKAKTADDLKNSASTRALAGTSTAEIIGPDGKPSIAKVDLKNNRVTDLNAQPALKPGQSPIGEDDVRDEVDSILKYEAELPAATSRSPRAQAVRAEVFRRNREENLGFNEQTSRGTRQAVNEFNKGTAGRNVLAINTFANHAASARDYFDALKNGDVQVINKAKNAVAEQFGEAAASNWKVIQEALGDEFVKMFVPAGGGVKEREHVKELFSRAKSPDQMLGAIDTAGELAAGRTGPLRQQYEQGTKLKNFDDRLSDGTKLFLANKGKSANTTNGAGPKKGAIVGGYVFMGGDPRDPKNWKK